MPSKKRKAKVVRGGRWKVTPIWRQWDKECNSCKKFLKQLKECKTMGGEKWRASMKDHYTNRLAELQSDEPKKYL